MTTRPAAFNDNAAGAGRAPSFAAANDNGAAQRSASRPAAVRAAAPWAPTLRTAALAARAVSDGTPPLALAIYAGLAALSIGAFLFAGCGPS